MTRSGTGTRLIMLFALLAPLAACGPFGSRQSPPGEEVLEYGTPAEYLTCSESSAGAQKDTVVGPGAATVRAGRAELSIGAGALGAPRRIILVEVPGQEVAVTIDGEAGRNAAPPPLLKPVTLRIDIGRCTDEEFNHPRGWWVWRMNPAVPDSSEKLRSVVNPQQAIVIINRTSKFMIAN